jgi:hypothetical protein
MSSKYDITFSDGSTINIWKIRAKGDPIHTSYFDNIERRLGIKLTDDDFITESEMTI